MIRRDHAAATAATLAVAGLLILGGRLLADQVVLVPGTIAGTVRIGTLPISQIQISATPQTGGNSTTFVSTPNITNAPYSMTVSVPQSGSSMYNVTGFFLTDSNRDQIRFSTIPVIVSAALPAQQDFILDHPGFIVPSFTVTGPATLSSVSLSATYSAGGVFEQATTNAPATTNLLFPAIPRTGMSLTGSVTFSNGLQVQLPARTIDVVADQNTPVAYTVDSSATGSIGGTISFTGPVPIGRTDISASGPTFKSIVQQPPPVGGGYSVGPLTPGNYTLTATARLNNFDDTFTFPNVAYVPTRSNLIVGAGETTANVSAAQAFINGTVLLTGGSTLQPFVNGGSVSVSGNGTTTSGGSASDQMTVATRAFDLIVSPGIWRFSSTSVSFFRPAPFLSGSFNFSDNRASAVTTIAAAGDVAAIDIPIALGEVTITVTIAGGGTFSNPSVSTSCVQRDDLNNVLWTSSSSFSTSGQNNVTNGSVTFVGPSGQCTVTPRVVINNQTVSLPVATIQVIAGSSQTVDVGGPSLTVTSPAPSTIFSTSSISASGKASDDVAVASVTVNGIATNLSSAGNPADPPQVNFSTVSPIVLQRGPNLITTIAKDTASPQNSTTDTEPSHWDTALPTLSFTPATGFTTQATSVTVAGTASDDAGSRRSRSMAPAWRSPARGTRRSPRKYPSAPPSHWFPARIRSPSWSRISATGPPARPTPLHGSSPPRP